MEVVEFNKAFDVNEFKGLINRALYVAAPTSVKTKWRDIISMILMNTNPTLAVKIKLWDMFCVAGFMDATPEMSAWSNKIMKTVDIDIVRNIVYIDDVYVKWAHTSLLLSKDIVNKRDSEGILDAMLKVVDDGSAIGNQVRAMINDHPQVDPCYKHLQATVEKVLYNNGQLVNSVYTISPDGKNVSIGGRRIVCGAGNGYYLDPRGALRVSPKWRLVFLPDGNYAIEDSSHAVVLKGDLSAVSGFCGANFGIDIVRVLRDNNIEANISNNSSVGDNNIRETIDQLLKAKDGAEAILEEISATIADTAGRYDEELQAAEKVVKKRINAISKMLYFYEMDPENGCPIEKNDGTHAEPVTHVTESIQPSFDSINNNDEDTSWIYDLLNVIASEILTKEKEESEEYTVKGIYKGKIKDIKAGIYGVLQIVEVKENEEHVVSCDCMRMKGDVDDTYTEWSFKINTNTGEYEVILKEKDAPEDVTSIFGIYDNAKEYAKGNVSKILAFLKAIKDTQLGSDNNADEPKDKDSEVNEKAVEAKVKGEPEDDGDNFNIEVTSAGLKHLIPIISKCRLSNKSVAEYNGSLVDPVITVINSDINKSKPVATIEIRADDSVKVVVVDSKANKGKTLGDIFSI